MVCDLYKETQVEYVAEVELEGEEVWRNVMLNVNKFKTAEAKILKSFENVNVVEFIKDGEFLLNNIIWA